MAEVTRDPAVTAQEAEFAEIQRLHKDRSELTIRLQKLEEKRAAAKPEIVEKVRTEYQSKLDQVEGTLSEKTSGLKAELDRLELDRKGVLEEKAKIDDAIAEVELRHSVGEYADDLKESLEDTKKTELKTIVSRLEGLESKITTISHLLSPDGIPPKPTKPHVLKKEVTPSKAELASEHPPKAVPTPEEASIPQQGQLIKCPSCGTSNPPDNWYCEKCGRELIGAQ